MKFIYTILLGVSLFSNLFAQDASRKILSTLEDRGWSSLKKNSNEKFKQTLKKIIDESFINNQFMAIGLVDNLSEIEHSLIKLSYDSVSKKYSLFIQRNLTVKDEIRSLYDLVYLLQLSKISNNLKEILATYKVNKNKKNTLARLEKIETNLLSETKYLIEKGLQVDLNKEIKNILPFDKAEFLKRRKWLWSQMLDKEVLSKDLLTEGLVLLHISRKAE